MLSRNRERARKQGIPYMPDRCKVRMKQPTHNFTHAQNTSYMNIVMHICATSRVAHWDVGVGPAAGVRAMPDQGMRSDKGMQAANNMASKLPISTLN